MLLCVACSATLDSNHQVPTHTEKEVLPIHFDCGHAVCGGCIQKRRSLAQACILCETTNDVLLRGSSSRAMNGVTIEESSTTGTNRRRPQSMTQRKQPIEGMAPPSYQHEDFVLGDDDDDDDDSDDEERPTKKDVLATSLPIDEDDDYDDDDPSPPTYDATQAPPSSRESDKKEKATSMNGDREQCSLHYLKPEDTLLGLALHYKVDFSTLAKMNKLPISTLSTTPHLLHTLPFLLLPPSISSSSSATPILPPAEERKRLVIRRFQMHTRCADWALAKAYVDQIYQARAQQIEMTNTNRRARGDEELVECEQGGELELAIEAWKKDEEWEKGQVLGSKDGKGKATMIGSRLRSTGQVEAKVKGWSWPR